MSRERLLTATTTGLNGALAVWLALMLASRPSEPRTASEIQATPAPATAEAAPPAERGGSSAPEAVAAVVLPPPPRLPVRVRPPRQAKLEPAPQPEPPPRRRPITALRPSASPEIVEQRDREMTPLRPRPPPQTEMAVTAMSSPRVGIEATAPTAPPQPEVVAQGWTLLRLQEHGAGPGIEIAWPDEAAERERLHAILRRCHGMRLALMTPEGKLYRAGDAPGTAWQVDLDRFSGFIREAQGRLASEERREIGRLRRHHGIDGNTVRIFPRVVDAAFFGGLGHIVGQRYGEAERIRARYRLTAMGIEVASIRLDGKPVAGRIALPTVTLTCAGP